MKKRWFLSFLILLGALSACTPELLDVRFSQAPSEQSPTGKVRITFELDIPSDGPATKAMAELPQIQNMYVAVFGGSGYFNEWVPVEIEKATENSTRYLLKMDLSTSDSRLRLHFIANSPVSEPPITGISSQDTEDLVMSRIRSTLGKTDSNGANIEDAYWQKKILPHGVKPLTALREPDEHGYQAEYYPTDPVTGAYYPSVETRKQFQEYNESTQEWGDYIPIPLVRNFARIYLVNMAKDVIIFRYALAYAPIEGPVAPILAAPYYADEEGNPLSDNGSYLTASQIDAYAGNFWYESFFINMQDHPLIATTELPVAAGDHPFFYDGYSPTDQTFGSYPENDSEMSVWADETKTWTYDGTNEKWKAAGDSDPVNTAASAPSVLYVYERSTPSSAQRATRIIIKALKNGETSAKYYALDIVNNEQRSVALLRNNTYTVRLTGIEVGSGQGSIQEASEAASALVSGDSGTQDIPQISDGKMSIGTSYVEQLYVQPGSYDVMFRFIPDNAVSPNPERNDNVTLQVGWKDEEHNVFYLDDVGTNHNSLGPSFATVTSGGTGGEGKPHYAVAIEKNGSNVVQYVRSENQWKKATEVSGSESMEKWGRITFTTVGTESSSTVVDGNGYFNESRVQTIRVIGTRMDDAGTEHTIYRDVIIRLSPRKSMRVECLQKFVPKAAGFQENVRVYIPTGLPASIFPADFKIEPDKHSLTPYNDVLPVTSGASIVPNVSGPSYYFIKEMTRSEYEGLPTKEIDGTTWKYFDCHFKTTIADNAGTVYVQNKYFVNSAGNYSGASDDYKNYMLRYFTDCAFSEKVADGEPVTFSFKMDTAHASASGGLIWWDKDNANASLDTYRVLPKQVTVKLEGVYPDGTSQLSRQANWPEGVYVYQVGNTGNAPTVAQASVDLNLIAQADNYSVTLSTEHIDPVFDLYDPVTVNQDKVKKTWKTKKYTLRFNSENYNKTSFPSSDGAVSLTFNNTEGNGNNGQYFKYMGTREGLIIYTYSDGEIQVSSDQNALEGCVITGMAFTYNSNNNNNSVTANTGTISNNKLNWSSSSSGEGNGDTNVTITMSCTSRNQYSNRNQLKSITVTYGYWE